MSNEGLDLPEIDINLEGEDIRAFGGGGGPLLPVGTFTFDISAAKQDTSKKGQPVVKVTFKVVDEGEFFGVELTKSYSLQPQALGRIKHLMMAAGCRLDKIRPAELIGSRIIAEIIHTEGQGQVDPQGNVVPGRMLCDVVKETGVEAPVEAPPPPPAAKGAAKAATAPAPAAPPAATKNGQPAARRA